MNIKTTQRRLFTRDTTRCYFKMEKQSANWLFTMPIGDKILEVEIPGDDVPPQGAHEDGGPSGGCLDQGVLGLGEDEVLPEVGAGEDHKVILERMKKVTIDLHLRSNSLRVGICES